MTDRHGGYIVALENDMRDDDAEPILNAIKQIRGVLDVRPVVACPSDFIMTTRERSRLWSEIFKIFKTEV